MIASAAIQAAFNVGNALGAFGVAIGSGLVLNLVGVAMALSGALITVFFLKKKRRLVGVQT
jgi:DHA1 family arabinose polymer transporter-like MFS transporter